MKHLKKYLKLYLLGVIGIIYFVMDYLQIMIVKGTSLQLFDVMMFKGYDLAYANQFINEISNQGKNIYLFAQIPLDFIFPILFSVIFYLFFFEQTNNKKIALLGFSSAVFDYAENILVIMMLTTTNLTQGLVGTASVVTMLKGAIYFINIGFMVFLAIRCRYRKGCPFKNKAKKTS